VGGLDSVVDRVGKTSKQRAPDVRINEWVKFRVVLDSINARQKFINEFTPQTIASLLVTRLLQIGDLPARDRAVMPLVSQGSASTLGNIPSGLAPFAVSAVVRQTLANLFEVLGIDRHGTCVCGNAIPDSLNELEPFLDANLLNFGHMLA